MAIVRVQGAVASSTIDVASVAVTLAGAATNGNLLIGTAGRRVVNANIGVITRPTGFTLGPETTAAATGNVTSLSYKVVSGDGTGPFTFTNTVQNQEIAASVVEWSGIKTTSLFGDSASSYNSTAITGGTTSINVDTTGTLSLLVFAMTHSDVGAVPITSLAYSNSFNSDIGIVVMVDGNDVDHYTATKIVTSPTNQACVATWGTTAHISSQVMAEFFGVTASGNPPVLTVPGSQDGVFGTPLDIDDVEVADDDGDATTFEASCEASMTITFDVSGTSVTPTGNGTNDVSLSGTQAELNTVLSRGITVARAELWPTYEASNILTITAIDGNANEDEETITVNWTAPTSRYKSFTGTAASIIAAIQALVWTPTVDASGSTNVRMAAATSAPLSSTSDFQFVVTGTSPVIAVPATQQAQYGVPKAIGSVSVAHAASLTSSLRFQSPVVMPMTFSAGATGATIAGNETNDVLIEDSHDDLNTVAATLSVAREAVGVPVPSELTPASANVYEVKADLQVGNVVYTDRDFEFVAIPAAFLGATWIKTPNDDKASADAATLVFTLDDPAWVYLTRDNRSIETVEAPSWLSDWESVADEFIINSASTDVTYSVFRQSFPAGTVTLGGYDFGILYSHYTVIITSIAATIPIKVTATDSNGLIEEETFNVAWSISGGGGDDEDGVGIGAGGGGGGSSDMLDAYVQIG